MADEAKKKPSRSMVIAVIALICLIIVPAVIMFNDTYATWRIFTKGHIDELEQTFAADFSEEIEFDSYKKVYAFQAGTYHTLYITGIENPEDFCRNTVTGILFMADLRGEEPVEIIANDNYSNAERFQGQQWYDGEARHTDFVCVYKGKPYNTVIYFFENDSGGYDAKFTQ